MIPESDSDENFDKKTLNFNPKFKRKNNNFKFNKRNSVNSRNSKKSRNEFNQLQNLLSNINKTLHFIYTKYNFSNKEPESYSKFRRKKNLKSFYFKNKKSKRKRNLTSQKIN